MVGFAGLRDLNDGRFCWVMRFQCWSVLFGYEISMMVGFAGLGDFKDGQFCFVTSFQGWSVEFGYKISMTPGLFGHEISVTASLVWLRNLNDCRFWWVMRSQ